MSFLYHFESPRENYSDAAGGAFPNGFLLDNPPLSWGASRGARSTQLSWGNRNCRSFRRSDFQHVAFSRIFFFSVVSDCCYRSEVTQI